MCSEIFKNVQSKIQRKEPDNECQSRKVKKGPQAICPEFMILGHSLWSHAFNMIYSYFSGSLFMAKSSLETCTSLDIAGVFLWKLVFLLSV